MEVRIEGIKPIVQRTSYTCGPAALRTIFAHYGVKVSERELVEEAEITEDGTGFTQMKQLARSHGFTFREYRNGTINDLRRWLLKDSPVLTSIQDYGAPNGNNGHYVVVVGMSKRYVHLADPANYYEATRPRFAKQKRMSVENFTRRWFDVDDNVVKGWYAILHPRNV